MQSNLSLKPVVMWIKNALFASHSIVAFLDDSLSHQTFTMWFLVLQLHYKYMIICNMKGVAHNKQAH